uniref:SJCHGC02134 protein n=1 Tax=Schistosoma japonicum TaxID=6182 RepID=Q5BTA9_SCHJA|nr:SJCHGC02134 protein [Schistosoma japonicum]
MDPAYLGNKEEYNDIPTGVDISRDYNQASNVSSDSLIKMRAQWTGELKQMLRTFVVVMPILLMHLS